MVLILRYDVHNTSFHFHHSVIDIFGWQDMFFAKHSNDVIMSAIASQITSLKIVYPTVYLDANPRKHQSSVSLAFVRGIHRSPVNSPHKGPVTRKRLPFDGVIMTKLAPSESYLISVVWLLIIHDFYDTLWNRRSDHLAHYLLMSKHFFILHYTTYPSFPSWLI